MSLFNSSKKKKKTAVSPLVRGSAAAGVAAQARAKKSAPKKQKPKQTVQPAKAAMSKAPVAKKKTTATSASGRNDSAVRQSYGQRAGTRTSSGAYKPTQSAAYNYKKAETKRSTISTDIKNQTKVKTQKPSVVSGPVKESRDNRDKRMRQSWSQRHPENQVQREQRKEEQRPKSYVPTRGMAVPTTKNKGKKSEWAEFEEGYNKAGILSPNERTGIAEGPLKDRAPLNMSQAKDIDTMLSGGTVPGMYIPDDKKPSALEYNIRMTGQDALSKPYAEEIWKNASVSEKARILKAATETVGFNEQTRRWSDEFQREYGLTSSDEKVKILGQGKPGVGELMYRDAYDKYKSAVKQQEYVDKWAKDHGYGTSDYMADATNLATATADVGLMNLGYLPLKDITNIERKPGDYFLGGVKAPYEGVSSNKSAFQNLATISNNIVGSVRSIIELPFKGAYYGINKINPDTDRYVDDFIATHNNVDRINRDRYEMIMRMNSAVNAGLVGKKSQVAGNIEGFIIQQIPAIATMIAAGPEASSLVGGTTFFGTTAGAYAQSALDSGASLEEAMNYGILGGLGEGATEMIFPMAKGIGGGLLKGGANTINKRILFGETVRELEKSGFANSMSGRILRSTIYNGGEATEEMIMEIIDPYLQRASFNPEAENASLAEIGMAGLYGAAVSAVLHIPMGMMNTAQGLTERHGLISNARLYYAAKMREELIAIRGSLEAGMITEEEAEQRTKEVRDKFAEKFAEAKTAIKQPWKATGSLLNEQTQGGEYKTSSNLEHLYSSRQEANAATVEPGTSAYFMEDGEVKRITHSEGGVKSEDAVLTNSEKTAYAEKAERLRTSKNNTERTGVQANVRQDIIDQAAEMARVYNRNVEFYRDEEAAKRYDDRGRFDPKTETIYVNAATDKPLQTIISHEMVHAMRNTNAFKELLREIKTYYKDSYDADVNDIRRMYSERDENGNVIEPDKGIIEEEVVAHFVEKKLLTDEAWVNTFLTNSRTDKILRGINTLLQRGLGGKEARFLASVRSKWLNALEEERGEQTAPRTEAVAAAKEAREAKPTTDPVTEVRHAMGMDRELSDKAVKKNKTTKNVDPDLLEKAIRDREYIRDTYSHLFIPDEEGDKDNKGKAISALQSNDSYGKTLDNSSVCLRSLAVEGMVEEIAAKLGHPLTEEQSIFVVQQMQVYGAEKAECLYCYFTNAKRGFENAMNNYIGMRTQVAVNYNAGMSDEENYAQMLGARPGTQAYEDKDNETKRERFKTFLAIAKGLKQSVPVSYMLNTRTLNLNILNPFISEDFRNQLKDVKKYAQGAVKAHGRVAYAPYKGEIRKLRQDTVDKLMNKYYGLRMFSFSDFSPAYILEIMQMITDAAVRGMNVLAYTKEADFVKIFGKTGMSINMSIAGFKDEKTGEYICDGMNGMDWQTAKDLREEYPAVGITYVAKNGDEEVEWAMKQPWIDTVIPFHISFGSKKMQTLMGWTNYNGKQSDKKMDGWTKGKDADSISPAMHHNDKEKYLELCEKNHLSPRFSQWLDDPNYMKLVNETRQSVDEMIPVQPDFEMDAAIDCLENFTGYDPVDYIWGSEKAKDAAVNRIYRKMDEKGIRNAKGSRDSEYLSAVERGDMATAQRLVDEAAKEAGYTVDVYHGTYSFGRTRFDLFGGALFLTDSVGVARNFSGGQPARSIKDNFDADTSPLNDVINYAKENTYIGDQLRFATIDDFDREADRIRPDEGLLKYGQDIYDSNVRMYEILQELRDDFLDGTTYLYMDYNSIGDDYANVPVFTEQTLREFVKNYKPNPSYSGGGVYRLVLRPKKMITINVNGGYYMDVPIPKELEKFATKEEIMRGYATSDQILRMANGAGYDTVKYAEMREGGDYGNAGISNVYATLNATENVKSADPVTYDKNGKVIPLSERFNEKNDDIRWAKGSRDEEYLAAVERGDMETAQRLVDEAAEEAGYTYHLYHGTNAEFTAFDVRKFGGKNGKGEGYGIYLASNRAIAEPYGKNLIESYVNFNRLAEEKKRTLKYAEVRNLIKKSCELEAKQFVEDEEHDTLEDALRDTWVSNYVYTYDYQDMNQVYADVTDIILQGNENDADIINEIMLASGAHYDYDSAMDFYDEILTPETGIDGFHYIWGEDNDVYLAFRSSQIKLADPVTRHKNGKIILPSERFDENKKDIRYAKGDRDAEYLAAVERGDMETASRMVREAARKAGFNSPKLFHGTNAFGFTKIDTNVPEADGFSFWASTSEATSATYTRYGKVRRISEDIRPEEIDALYDQTEAELNDAISHFRGLIDRTFSEWFFGQTDNSRIYQAVYFANPEEGFGDGVYDVLMDMVADAYYQYGEELQEQYDDYLDWQEESDDFDNIKKAIIDIEGIREKIDDIDESIDGGIYELYGNTDNMFVLECNGALWNNLRPEGLPKLKTAWSDDAFYNTRSVAVWARNQGYDGVIFKDIRDNGQYGRTEPADVYAFFNPVKQVKSADPVTYDDDGEVIPLSERFSEKNELRYAKGSRDSEYLAAVERGDMETAQRLVDEAAEKAMAYSKARNKNGNLLPLYHYTDNEFTTFDLKRSGSNQGKTHGEGIYLSSHPTEFAYAGKRRMRLYADIRNPFEMQLNDREAEYILNKFASTKHNLDKHNGLYRNHAMSKLMSPTRVFDYLQEYADDNNITTIDILYELGYDGVHDGMEWVAFFPKQIKLADPITRHKNGKIIPLSERFNQKENDIRYAKGQRRSSEAVETAKYHTKKLKYALYNRDRADNKELWDMLRAELNKAYSIGAYDPRVAEKIIDFAYRTGYQLEDNGNERFSLREKISIPEEYRGEMESLGGLAAVNRSIFGTGTVFTYKNNGIAIDEAYDEARDMRPDLFPETDNPSEQVQNIIDALTKVSDKIPLEELDREEDNPFEDSGDPIYNEIRDAVIAAMDDIAAIGRIDMVNRAKREGKNLSAKAQYRKGRESGKKQGQRSGYNTAKREQDRTDRATMREFDKLERQRAIDRAKQENQDRRDDEATMREFDNVMKKVRQDERKLSQQEKKELRKNYESREKDIRAEKNRLIHRLRVEKRSWQDAAERMESERKKQQRSLDTKQRQEMRKKQQKLDEERREERLYAALDAYEERKEEEQKGSSESLYKRNREVQSIIDDFRTHVLQVAARMGAFKKEGSLLLDHNDVVIAESADGYDYTLKRDKNVVPSFALTILAEQEGMKKEDFYGVYAELQKMQTERDEKGNRVYTKRDILEYIVSLRLPASQKSFLYFDVMKYRYDKKPVFKDGGPTKIKPGNYFAGELGEAIDRIGLDMFTGAGVKLATDKSFQIKMENVDELLDMMFTDEEMKEVARTELVQMIADFEADIEEARMIEQTNLLTDNPKEIDSRKLQILSVLRDSKKLFLAEGEAFERFANTVKNPLLAARYYAAKASMSIARDYINGHGIRKLDGTKEKVARTKQNGDEYDVEFVDEKLSLTNIMKPALKGTKESDALLKDLTRYVYAQHNIDRMKYDKGFMELSEEECRAIIDEIGKNKQVVKMADDLVLYGQRLLRLCVESGVISEEDYEYFTTKYPHYVPTFRLREDEVFDRNGNIVKRTNKVIKEAQKSNADLIPLYDQMVRRTQEIVKACKKNQLAAELVKAYNKDGAWDYIIDVRPAEPTSGNEDYIYGIGQIEDRGLKNRDFDGEDNLIPVYLDGVKYNIAVADKNLLYGWDRLNYYRDESTIPKMMRKMNTLRRWVLTQYNPIFWATNGIKDSIDMYLYNQHAERLPLFQVKALSDIFHKKGHDSFAEYLSFGAASSSFFEYDERRRSKARKLKDKAAIPFKGIDFWNFLIEQWPRYTVYLEECDRLTKEREKGKNEYSDEEIKTISAYRAADATVNFGRSGTVVKAANTYGATFLNAGVQGMDRFRRMFTQVKGENKQETLLNILGLMIKLAAVGLAPSMIADWLYGGNDDDEDKNKLLKFLFGEDAAKVVQEYAEMADYERTNYLNIKLPGMDGWIRIPKGRVVSFIYGWEYNGEKVLSGDMSTMDLLYTQWDLFAENIMPGNPLTNNILQPVLDVAKNRDFWGNEIVSQWEQAQDGFHWTESNEDTSIVARKIAEYLHYIVSGGKEMSPEYIDLSPIKIDYLLQQYGGSWTKLTQPFISAIGDGQDQRFVDMIQDAFKDSMWGKFYLDPVLSNRLAGDYYDLKDEYTGLSDYYGQDTPYAVALKGFKDHDEDLKALRDELNYVSKDASLTWKERLAKMREIREQMNDIYRVGVKDAKSILEYASDIYGGKDMNKDIYDAWQADAKGPDWVIDHMSDSAKVKWDTVKSEYSSADPQNFVDTYNYFSGLKGDKDENGKTVHDSKRQKFVQWLDNQPYSAAEKQTLYTQVGGYKTEATFKDGGSGTTKSNKDALKEKAEEIQANTKYMPVKEARISSEFGMRTHPISGKQKMHTGIDIAVGMGTDVVSARKGVVEFAGSRGGYGNRVVIDHGDGMKTTYSHLSEIGVKPGDTVNAGTLIAKSGSTGASTGPHLHFEVEVNGSYVNPRDFFDFDSWKTVSIAKNPDYSAYAPTKSSGGGGGGRKSGGKKSGGSSGGKKGKATTQAAYTPTYAPTTTRYSGSSGSSGSSAGKSSGKATRTPAARRTQTSVAKGIMLPTAREIDSAKRRSTSQPTVARNGGKSASRGIVLPTAAEVASAATGARIGYGSGTSSIRRTNRSRGSFWHENVLG